MKPMNVKKLMEEAATKYAEQMEDNDNAKSMYDFKQGAIWLLKTLVDIEYNDGKVFIELD